MRVPPVIGERWQVWAEDLRRYLGKAGSQLSAKETTSSATEDGVILWDRSAGVVVSRSGAFIGLPTIVAVPATATSAGVAGDIAYDGTHIYVCIASNTWRRAAVATW